MRLNNLIIIARIKVVARLILLVHVNIKIIYSIIWTCIRINAPKTNPIFKDRRISTYPKRKQFLLEQFRTE